MEICYPNRMTATKLNKLWKGPPSSAGGPLEGPSPPRTCNSISKFIERLQYSPAVLPGLGNFSPEFRTKLAQIELGVLRPNSTWERSPQMYLVVLCFKLIDNPKGGGIAGIGPDQIGMLCESAGLKTGFDGLCSDGASFSTAAFNKRGEIS